MASVDLHLSTEADTVALAERCAVLLPDRCVVALDGTLGAGKTRFVQAFARACGVPAGGATSPTFTLWQTYRGKKLIHHLDAYRIADDDEFLELGVEECFDAEAVTFIEWAERVVNCLPEDRISIRFLVESESGREVEISTQCDRLQPLLSALKD